MRCSGLASAPRSFRVRRSPVSAADKRRGRKPIGVRPRSEGVFQAQLDPTALSVLDMLLPAVCTFWPWALACS